jgi:hypothetical protein
MKYNRTIELPEKGEGYRTDDTLAEALEAQRKPEPLEGIKTAEGAGTTGEDGKDDAPGNHWEENQDRWMESVRAFIRNIDINTL